MCMHVCTHICVVIPVCAILNAASITEQIAWIIFRNVMLPRGDAYSSSAMNSKTNICVAKTILRRNPNPNLRSAIITSSHCFEATRISWLIFSFGNVNFKSSCFELFELKISLLRAILNLFFQPICIACWCCSNIIATVPCLGHDITWFTQWTYAKYAVIIRIQFSTHTLFTY